MTDSGSKFLLKMKNIHKSFYGVEVLNDVCFNLYPGEVHIMAGENGAGKSTLMKILGGVYTDHSGSVEVEGREVNSLFYLWGPALFFSFGGVGSDSGHARWEFYHVG